MNPLTSALEATFDGMAPELLEIYKDLHRHPELSMQERRTAGIAADYIEKLGYAVTRAVGVTGVVGLLRNGDGPTVMLRGDMDALPMAEDTGLPYASQATATDTDGQQVGVAHSCGHDLHVTWLLGAARVLAESRDAWQGTAMVVFQPGEEVAEGARRMVEDWDRAGLPHPDVILGQHVMVGPAGTVSYRSGVILSAGDSLKVKLFGRGSHGSQPQTSIDPVIMAASTTLRLQTIVSREVSPLDSAVLTVGSLQAGTKENIIPDDATIKLNMRTYNEDVRDHMLKAVKRICRAECEASNAPRPPEFTTLSSYPLTDNDRRCHGAGRRRLQGAVRRRRVRNQTGGGQRGLQRVRPHLERALRVLVRRRHRSAGVCEGEAGAAAQYHSQQSLAALRPGTGSHVADGPAGHAERRVGMAVRTSRPH